MRRVDKEDLREALKSMNDNVSLAQTQLASRLPEIDLAPDLEQRANRLRSLLLQTIELLRPPRRYPFGSLESRSYDVLVLRYVEGMTVQEMSDELAISRRQIHRDLSLAEEKLASILASSISTSESARRGGESQFFPFATSSAAIDILQLLDETVELVRPLADELQLRLEWQRDQSSATYAIADRSMLKQMVIQALSSVIQSAVHSPIRILAEENNESISIALLFWVGTEGVYRGRFDALLQIAQAQGIPCQIRLEQGASSSLVLRIPAGKRVTVLIIEDNPGAVELYRRYLTAAGYGMYALEDPRLAVETAARAQPDIILLDIMLPAVDGWSLLEKLRSISATADIPIVVCSVVDDPQLARVLGAQKYLKKPVSQGELLTAIEDCLHNRGVSQDR